MKKLILMILIAAVGFVQAEAQSDQNEGKRKAKMDKAEMKQKRNERLNLNDNQSKKLDEINERYGQKMKAVREEEKSRNAEVYKDLKENREAEVKAILDEKQFAEWKESQKKMHKRSKDRKGKMKAAPQLQERSIDKG
jgi:hypothetical protein